VETRTRLGSIGSRENHIEGQESHARCGNGPRGNEPGEGEIGLESGSVRAPVNDVAPPSFSRESLDAELPGF
jgi:hypothetical protein